MIPFVQYLKDNRFEINENLGYSCIIVTDEYLKRVSYIHNGTIWDLRFYRSIDDMLLCIKDDGTLKQLYYSYTRVYLVKELLK